LEHIIIDHPIDGLPLIVIQIRDDASLGGYLVERIQSGAGKIGAAGALLLDHYTTSGRWHGHFGTDLQPTHQRLPVTLATQALLHAGHHRFVREPRAIVVTPYGSNVINFLIVMDLFLLYNSFFLYQQSPQIVT